MEGSRIISAYPYKGDGVMVSYAYE